ncbi:MAG: alanine--tRNA ligase [Candidatus Nanogingivalaceae bacterium]|nr:alanine--tRNA ligase [Candidatus Nanogingivalaceae bacterium]
MNAQEIRKAYLEFCQKNGHKIIKRASLILKDDPTTLFTGSGMQPLLPYLLGKKHPDGVRLTDSQTCLRAQDIDDVGDNRHTTFFEMLGNWSLGDYFKEQQIRQFFEFLTDVVGLDPSKIYVSCFIGNKKYNIPRDDESAKIWQKVFAEKGIDAKIVELDTAENGDKLGLQGGRIFFYNDKENWWSRGGGLDTTPIGDPCGPDSEVFYDFGEENHDASFGEAHPASDSGRFMEIGNQVFMQYRRLEDGSFEPLEHKNVDFGGGLERIAAAKIDNPDVFQISLMKPIIEKIEEISGKKYDENTASMRVIADHLRSAAFLAVDGCVPSNKEQGYVMRKFIRRAMAKAFDLGIEDNFVEQIIPVIVDIYAPDYQEVAEKGDEIVAVMVKEEKAFRRTLQKGLRELEKFSKDGLTGVELFQLYDTFGFPLELSTEEAVRRNISLSENWQEEFNAKMKEQRERSQTASKGKFKGGLEGQTLEHRKLHTATHLMNAALHNMFEGQIAQKGSNINTDRLRFDFTFDRKLTDEEKKQIEDTVNEQISKGLEVSWAEYPTDYALNELKAIGVFGDKYGETVKVYTMKAEGEKPFSVEICGGPHVDNTRELSEGGKKFKIVKEQSSSAGVRRIKAVLQ